MVDGPAIADTRPAGESLPVAALVRPSASDLRVENVAVLFKTFWALRGASFVLPQGSILGLIGPNGAGKTTLLRVLAGLQQPTAGTASISGRVITDGEPQPDIGFVPDIAPVFDRLTPRQFLALIGALHGHTGPGLEDKIAFWLDKLWMTQKAGQKISTLSRGMKQRVGIGAALIADPQILLLDEPASGLDPAGRVQFRQLLGQLKDMGKTLIVSSHILSDLAEYCTHVGMMSAGRIIRFDEIGRLSASQAHTLQYRIGLVQDASSIGFSATIRYTGGMGAALQLARHHTSHFDGAQVDVLDNGTLGITYSADPAAMAELLEKLVHAGLPIWHCSPVGSDLEKLYLSIQSQQVD